MVVPQFKPFFWRTSLATKAGTDCEIGGKCTRLTPNNNYTYIPHRRFDQLIVVVISARRRFWN